MKPVSLSKQAARNLILHAQWLDEQAGRLAETGGLLRIIRRLGYVQIDTIHVIERAHHHTLWTRLPGYTVGMLHKLQASERSVFEYWTHAMAYLPMADYRFYLYRMKGFRQNGHPWIQYLSMRETLPLADVRKRIREEGALGAKDFTSPGGKPTRGTWWDWKPAKNALELLFWRGELMVSERRNFEKIYDLTERVLPPATDTRLPSKREMAEFLIRRALGSMAVANAKEIYGFLQSTAGRNSKFRAVRWDVLTRTIAEQVEAGTIVPAAIEDGEAGAEYILREDLERAAGLPAAGALVHLLSPFDNLIIRRRRLRRMFNFDYTLECYLPAAKRIYGYFVLPILVGDKLVGRLDPKADRKTGTLILLSVVLEDGFRPSDNFTCLLAAKIAAFAAFNGCRRVAVERTKPVKWKSRLNAAIRDYMSGIQQQEGTGIKNHGKRPTVALPSA
jgi:uncharacterized protein YcaQ